MPSKNLTSGVVKRHPDGFGFLIPDDPKHPDVYIPRNFMLGVMTNDRVEARAFREGTGDRYRGQITKILERATSRVMGQVARNGEHWLLRDRSFGWGEDLKLSDLANHSLREGDWVSAAITSYPDDKKGFCGKVLAVLADALNSVNDNQRVLMTHNIPSEFSKAALSEASTFPSDVTKEDFAGRRDLRALKFITIDGRTAKDFDDAIYVEQRAQGFHLYVAIADVSHYVKPNTAIDDDAYDRGTSTYFPNFVSPMLPEKLSNHLCSLMPFMPRLAFVSEMQLDFQGQLVSSSFYEAVIVSQARVTYGEAQEIIDGVEVENLKSVIPEILRARDLAKLLMAKRFREGSLDLDIPQTEVEIDDTGEPVDILKSERLFSHRLIEELMLIANVAVAKFFTDRKIPTVYRIHEEPKPEAIELLQNFIEVFGGKGRLSGGKLQKKISKLLEGFAGHPHSQTLHILTLRSMAQAKYSPHNFGHFGLGFSDYAHFTSPIRRYPDLVVHRQLKAALGIRGYSLYGQSELETMGTFLSACEQRSVKAERQITAIKKARFMKRFLGETFEGFISSVTKFGVFVALRRYDVDGLVRLDNLERSGALHYDSEQLRLVAKKSGMSYAIGDSLVVQVAAVDTEQGQIDFVLEGMDHSPPVAVSKKTKNFEKRRPPKDNRRGVRKARFSKSSRKGRS